MSSSCLFRHCFFLAPFLFSQAHGYHRCSFVCQTTVFDSLSALKDYALYQWPILHLLIFRTQTKFSVLLDLLSSCLSGPKNLQLHMLKCPVVMFLFLYFQSVGVFYVGQCQKILASRNSVGLALNYVKAHAFTNNIYQKTT